MDFNTIARAVVKPDFMHLLSILQGDDSVIMQSLVDVLASRRQWCVFNAAKLNDETKREENHRAYERWYANT